MKWFAFDWPLHVLRLWLGVGKGMLHVKYFRFNKTSFVSWRSYDCHMVEVNLANIRFADIIAFKTVLSVWNYDNYNRTGVCCNRAETFVLDVIHYEACEMICLWINFKTMFRSINVWLYKSPSSVYWVSKINLDDRFVLTWSCHGLNKLLSRQYWTVTALSLSKSQWEISYCH